MRDPIVSPQEAGNLLDEVSRVRKTTRSRLGEHTWMCFLMWAAVFAGAALAGGEATWYWVGAVPVALVATGLVESRLTWKRTVRRSEARYWSIGGAITVLSFGGGAVLALPLVAAWVWVVLGLGFAGFALLEYHHEAALTMGALAGLALLASATISDPVLVYRGMAVVFAVGTTWIAWRMKP